MYKGFDMVGTSLYIAIVLSVVVFRIVLEQIANTSSHLDTTRSFSGAITVNIITVYVTSIAFSYIVYDIMQH